MLLHPNAIPKDSAAGIGARGIDSNNSHRSIRLAIMPRQLIHQCALASTRRSRKPQNPCLPAIRKESLEQFRGASRAVFDGGYNPSQSADAAGAELLDERLRFWIQTDQCNAGAAGSWKRLLAETIGLAYVGAGEKGPPLIPASGCQLGRRELRPVTVLGDFLVAERIVVADDRGRDLF